MLVLVGLPGSGACAPVWRAACLLRCAHARPRPRDTHASTHTHTHTHTPRRQEHVCAAPG
jgi:hypothetical protein